MQKVINKKKLKQQFEKEMLSNYYLSRYQNHMSKLTNNHYIINQSIINNQINSRNSRPRKNFKELIKEKRLNSNSKVKNFKKQFKDKNQQYQKQKLDTQIFKKLENTLNQQLNQKIPSKIENGNYYSIQLKTYIENQKQFGLNKRLFQDQDNIDVQQSPSILEDSINGIDIDNNIIHNNQQASTKIIESAIKRNFQKRFDHSNNLKSKSKQTHQKIMSKKNQISRLSFNSDRNSPMQRLQSSQQFVRKASNPKQMNKSLNEKVPWNFSPKLENSSPKIQNSQKSRQQNKNLSFNNFQQGQKHIPQKNYSYQENLHKYQSNHKIYGINLNKSIKSPTNQQKINNQQNQQIDFLASIANINQQIAQQNLFKQQYRENDQPAKQFRQSVHDLSNISRFSMTSEEGQLIKENLCKQINQNQFGPYQNALSDLRDLIEDYPNAWPIFVVGQKMLEDRRQYEQKKQRQANQLKTLQQKIAKTKQNNNFPIKKTDNSKIIKNRKRIFELVRQLSKI